MRNYAEQSEAKKFWKYVKRNMLFALINSQKYFPCVSKTFPVLQQNSLCFPCLEKVRAKFPVFPVPWPPCVGTNLMLQTIVIPHWLSTVRMKVIQIYLNAFSNNFPFLCSQPQISKYKSLHLKSPFTLFQKFNLLSLGANFNLLWARHPPPALRSCLMAYLFFCTSDLFIWPQARLK